MPRLILAYSGSLSFFPGGHTCDLFKNNAVHSCSVKQVYRVSLGDGPRMA